MHDIRQLQSIPLIFHFDDVTQSVSKNRLCAGSLYLAYIELLSSESFSSRTAAISKKN